MVQESSSSVSVGTVVDNVAEFVRIATDIALGDPLSALLLGVGTSLFAISFVVFGYLSLGGVLSALVDLIPSGRGQPPRGR